MTGSLPPPVPLGSPGLIVLTCDGERLGRIEATGREAFKIQTTTEELWLRHQAVGRVMPGGFAILRISREWLPKWRWEPSVVRLSPDFGD